MSTFTVNCLDSKAHFETVSFDNIEYNSVNDYSMTSIEELADNIKKNGLYHCACGMRNPFSDSYDSKHGRKQKE